MKRSAAPLAPLVTLVLVMIAPAGCGESGEPRTAAAEDEQAIWFASVGGTELGPFTESELRRELEAGRIGADDHVWRDGMAAWETASTVLDVAPERGADAAGLAFAALCERAARVSDDDLTALQRFAGIDTTGRASSAQARAVLDRHAALLADVRNGCRTAGRLELDYAQGQELLLPHLAPARRLAKLLRLDAVYARSVDEHARAVADCAAIARIARQTAGDDVLISSLVSMSVAGLFAEACDQADVLPADAPALRDSTEWLGATDPFRIAGACRTERTYMVAAFAQAIRDGNVIEQAKIGGIDAAGMRALSAAANDLDHEVARCQAAFDAIEDLVTRARRPSPAEIDALRSRIDRGEFGNMAIALAAPAMRIVEQSVRAIDRVDPVLDRLGR